MFFASLFLYWKEIAEHKYLWVYYNICVFFVVANSSVNVFIYSLVSEEFRQSFKRFFSLNMGVSSHSATERTLRSPLSPLNLSPLNMSPLNERNDWSIVVINSNKEEMKRRFSVFLNSIQVTQLYTENKNFACIKKWLLLLSLFWYSLTPHYGYSYLRTVFSVPVQSSLCIFL